MQHSQPQAFQAGFSLAKCHQYAMMEHIFRITTMPPRTDEENGVRAGRKIEVFPQGRNGKGSLKK